MEEFYTNTVKTLISFSSYLETTPTTMRRDIFRVFFPLFYWSKLTYITKISTTSVIYLFYQMGLAKKFFRNY